MQDYITESNHGLLDYMVVTSAEFWKGLPDDVRKVVKTSLDEAIAYGNKIAMEKAESDKQAIIKSGRTQVISLTDAERAAWVKAMKPVWKKFEDDVGADMIEAALNANQ